MWRRLLPFSASATVAQAATYLLAISLFSIAFLVFLNSAISFVVTDLLGRRSGLGAIVGSLGFADELVALVACPVWGLLSDRVGVRPVAVLAYLIISAGLALTVRATAVYPDLLLARLLFALGASAAATMVSAILPSMTARSATPGMGNPAILAGYVGLFTGCGALLAVVLFLPLPAWFSALDAVSAGDAIRYSFYLVAAVALLVAVAVSFGLRRLPGEDGKGWRRLLAAAHAPEDRPLPYLGLLRDAVRLGLVNPDIALGYLGAFVARASTVAVSLFVPLFVKAFFLRRGFCHPVDDGADLSDPDFKRQCRAAYVLASVLTGLIQLTALLCAPLFGYLSARSRRFANAPLIVAAAAGVLAYVAFPLLPSPELHGPAVLPVAALMGASQIGAIVCSLAALSRGLLSPSPSTSPSPVPSPSAPVPPSPASTVESAPLLQPSPSSPQLPSPPPPQDYLPLKGSVAGVYSWCGGVAILILTKAGGHLFDAVSPAAPFYMMAAFNAVLLVVAVAVEVVAHNRRHTDALHATPTSCQHAAD